MNYQQANLPVSVNQIPENFAQTPPHVPISDIF